ncbi:hypothetical protein JW921_05490, partial [Candidatus Fermentibacterales bacterium]|nr:hypothetical protein [Candidatus Fermentibacterales bacterium]
MSSSAAKGGSGAAGERELHPLEHRLLSFLSAVPDASDEEIIAGSGLDEGSYRRAAEWVISRRLAEETSSTVTTEVGLGPLGEEAARAGTTPELALLELLDRGVSDPAGIREDDRFSPARWGSALGALLREGLVARAEGGSVERLEAGGGVFAQVWREVYSPLIEGRRVMLEELPRELSSLVLSRSPRRGKGRAEFVTRERTCRVLSITDRGTSVLASSREGAGAVGMLTPEMIGDGSWREARFRRYDLDIPPARIHLGRLHPYRQFLDRVRRRFVSMGFVEMTGPISESEFWNNDALFMPQYHPARDIHDVYYLAEGVRVEPPPPEVMERVARAHEDGAETGGRGWGYSFSRERALRPVLRSQGTSLSARCLASGPSVPGKYFAMARC